MILSDLRNYIRARGRVPIADLVNHFDADPDAVRGMLDVWIRKGKVSRLASDAGDCDGCAKCDAFELEIYEWTGP